MDRTKPQSGGRGDTSLFSELALSRDEDAELTEAFVQADTNFDGEVDEVEWSDFQISNTSQTLFAKLYDSDSASALRHKIFYEVGALLSEKGIVEIQSVEKHLAVFDSALTALDENEKHFVSEVPLSKLVREHSTYWQQYQIAKTHFTDALTLAHELADAGALQDISRQYDIVAARLKGAESLWQGYLGDISAISGHAANTSGKVVEAAALTEVVLSGGALALGEIGTVAGATTLSVSTHAGGATMFFPDYTAEPVLPQSKVTPVEDELTPVDPASEVAADEEVKPEIKLRTSDELAVAAKTELEEFKKTGIVTADLGHFLLEANLAADYETNAEYFPDILKEFDTRRTEHFKAASTLTI